MCTGTREEAPRGVTPEKDTAATNQGSQQIRGGKGPGLSLHSTGLSHQVPGHPLACTAQLLHHHGCHPLDGLVATSSLPSGTVLGLSHSQPVPRLAGGHQKLARDTVNNLTLWTITFNAAVFGRRPWRPTVDHTNPTQVCLALASPKRNNFVQTSHGTDERPVPKGTSSHFRAA